jgi:hypothetical protein
MNVLTRAGTSHRRLATAIVGALTVWCAACGHDATAPSPIAPPAAAPPLPAMSTISGTVWLHAADGVRPFAHSSVSGWVAFGTRGQGTGRIPTDANGRYVLSAPVGSRVRLGIGGGGAYQPCAVTVSADGDVIRDIHAVDDTRQLGARLPPQLLADTPTVSGQVFEIDAGGRRPVADVRVESDGLFGLGLVTATTLTDAEGRYVLCGFQGDASTVVFASKAGYQLFEATTLINGNTMLDIELRR